jgi:transposase
VEQFEAEFDVLLHDLTSSYIEGESPKNPMMRRACSRDRRPDCKQVVIALIVNVEGFPWSSETLSGNHRDVTTLEVLTRRVERKYG